jgi:predicted ribosome quality control (RQC) complex YloA/Tae2 family protein
VVSTGPQITAVKAAPIPTPPQQAPAMQETSIPTAPVTVALPTYDKQAEKRQGEPADKEQKEKVEKRREEQEEKVENRQEKKVEKAENKQEKREEKAENKREK